MPETDADALSFEVLTRDQPGFDEACETIAALYAEREAEFGFNAGIDRPVIPIEDGLADPRHMLLPIIAGDNPVTILTTWSDLLAPILEERAFLFQPIRWPAGPRNSGIFWRQGNGRQTYVELVDEGAPEIAPSHVVIAHDAKGCAGGAITVLQGDAAWLAVMCVRVGMPGGTGSRLWDALVADLAGRDVVRLDLGTQTAERFYLRCGMTVTHRVVSRLRWRPVASGRVWNDLVMMTLDL